MAIKQINDKGRTVTLRSKLSGTYDPIAGTITSDTDTNRSLKAVFTEYKSMEIDGSIIVRGDKQVLIADVSEPPDANDILIDGTDEYSIINIGAIQPGDLPILYKLQVRR
ncbi:hypothetical protein [Dyadobacter sp. CY323]|uniref:hypothetical protein n=1 Tax=Dyadobacter sp. CY323 TaxID=2907302 RepID=UPI001F3589FC|nr:hypothetical protein [Dyadobacter sp. CY323]MCE6993057.1 hypothetical protein [Dyadobacter sp. CY323]